MVLLVVFVSLVFMMQNETQLILYLFHGGESLHENIEKVLNCRANRKSFKSSVFFSVDGRRKKTLKTIQLWAILTFWGCPRSTLYCYLQYKIDAP